jgi:uncharacterized protein (DUF4213/DUF364 family)
MAFREIRFHFKDVTDQTLSKELNIEIGQPFGWTMDSIMRGNFKLYSGNEVKGVNLVNLICHSTASEVKLMETSQNWKTEEWQIGLNTYNCTIAKDFNIFTGSRANKVTQAINLFLEIAKLSDLPQMNTLIRQVNEKLNDSLIEKAIVKADKEWKALLENAWKYEKIIEEATKKT